MDTSTSQFAALRDDELPAMGAVASAVCCSCGQSIPTWRETLLPIASGELTVTERGELALRVDNRGCCDVCGDDRAEIRVEATEG